ncbi:MAG: hypothetical protein K8I82_12275 [Anaerolineae bacterium]|nr:hypothetical protein [Anaerolineae bacterium]
MSFIFKALVHPIQLQILEMLRGGERLLLPKLERGIDTSSQRSSNISPLKHFDF